MNLGGGRERKKLDRLRERQTERARHGRKHERACTWTRKRVRESESGWGPCWIAGRQRLPEHLLLAPLLLPPLVPQHCACRMRATGARKAAAPAPLRVPHPALLPAPLGVVGKALQPTTAHRAWQQSVCIHMHTHANVSPRDQTLYCSSHAKCEQGIPRRGHLPQGGYLVGVFEDSTPPFQPDCHSKHPMHSQRLVKPPFASCCGTASFVTHTLLR